MDLDLSTYSTPTIIQRYSLVTRSDGSLTLPPSCFPDPKWPLHLEILPNEFKSNWDGLLQNKFRHPDCVHTLTVMTPNDEHLYVDDILEIVQIFPNLRALCLMTMDIRPKYPRHPSSFLISRRYLKLDKLSIATNLASSETFPFAVASVLFLFSNIGSLDLSTRLGSTPDFPPLPGKISTPPPHISIKELKFSSYLEAGIFETFQQSPIISSLAKLSLTVYCMDDVIAISNLLRACTRLEDLSLNVRPFKNPLDERNGVEVEHSMYSILDLFYLFPSLILMPFILQVQ